MAYFNGKQLKYIPQPIPDDPGYIPPYPPTPPTPSEGSTPDIPRPQFNSVANVTLYRNHSETYRADKVLTDPHQFQIALKADVDILNPIILLESNINLSGFNYMYIDVFERYYNVTIQVLPGNLYQITANVDVLTTYKSDMRRTTAVIDKQENENFASKYLNDGSWVCTSRENTQIVKFKQGFSNTPEYILVTCGGPGVTPITEGGE